MYVAAACDVMERNVSPRVGQVDDRVGRYEHLGYRRVASIADHVQRSHSCSEAAQIDTKMNDSKARESGLLAPSNIA